MRSAIFSFLGILLILLFFALPTYSHQSGCHRWHSCPSDSGSYTCGDLGYPCRYGTWSGSSGSIYIPPTPTPIIIPSSVTGGVSAYNYNNLTKLYDVVFNWEDWNQSTGWSVAVSQYSGADPGPNMDTTSSYWTFKSVSPGTKYVNVKAFVNGYWSKISYWTINVPPLPTATPTPTNTPTPTITPIPKPTEIIKKNIKSNVKKTIQKKSFWNWLFNK